MSFPYKNNFVVLQIMQRVMTVSRTWAWVCLKIGLILFLSLNDVSEASQAEVQAQATALVGTVYCDPCFHQNFSKSTHFISGALVAVECGGDGVEVSGAQPRFREEVKTDEKGEFKVELPFSVSKRTIKGCVIKSILSSEPDCAVAVKASSTIRLKMKTSGDLVFSAGSFAFKPLKRPKECHTKHRNKNSNDEFKAPTPFPSPAGFVIPPITPGKQTTTQYGDPSDADALGLPFQANPFQTPFQFQPPFQLQPPPNSMFTPDFQPPPASIFDPLPLQPPPDSMFNPSPFQPSPPSFIPQFFTPPPPPPTPPPTPPTPAWFPSLTFPPLEPQPDFNQSPPPPPPPSIPPLGTLPPFAPFPFQPRSGYPGTPPAVSSALLKKMSSP